MVQNDPIPIYWFVIINQITNEEIGNIIYHHNGTIDDFNAIAIIKQKMLMALVPKKKLSITKALSNHIVIGRSVDGRTFYFAAIKKRNWYMMYKGLYTSLIKEIEHQGINKLAIIHGGLSDIGMKNLRFSIEQFKENYIENYNKKYNAKHYMNAIVTILNNKRENIKKIIEEILYEPIYTMQTNRNEGSGNLHRNNRGNEKNLLIRKVSFGLFIAFLFILHIYHTQLLYRKSKERSIPIS